MYIHGIPTVTLGCGQVNPHTVSERLDIPRSITPAEWPCSWRQEEKGRMQNEE